VPAGLATQARSCGSASGSTRSGAPGALTSGVSGGEYDEKFLLAQVVFDQSSGAGRQVAHPQLAHPVADERADGSGVLGFEQADRHPWESAPEGADQRGQGIDREGGPR
jgi:hypothetical protein